jgi:hypothetical protein
VSCRYTKNFMNQARKTAGYPDCRDRKEYNQTILHVEEVFRRHSCELDKVRKLAVDIRAGIEKISPFIQSATAVICPSCTNVCCISKHGYFNYEDIIYLSALGLKPPAFETARNDTDPCRFLIDTGCSMERSVRPSGCNWYFCDSLLDRMETDPAYRQFDIALQDVAHLWMEMVEEFASVSAIQDP